MLQRLCDARDRRPVQAHTGLQPISAWETPDVTEREAELSIHVHDHGRHWQGAELLCATDGSLKGHARWAGTAWGVELRTLEGTAVTIAGRVPAAFPAQRTILVDFRCRRLWPFTKEELLGGLIPL